MILMCKGKFLLPCGEGQGRAGKGEAIKGQGGQGLRPTVAALRHRPILAFNVAGSEPLNDTK